MTTSAVVVTYNRLPLLKEVIAALQASETPVDHLIVVDNHSDQETKEYLTKLGTAIEYVRLEENLGGAGGFNHGVRYFMEHTQDEFVWLMDDDTVPAPDALGKLLAFAKTQPHFGFLSSDVRWIDGHRAKMNNPAPKHGLFKIPENETTPVELMNATFVSLLVRRAVVAEIGLPITAFFIWGDDIEYTERAGRVAPGYFVPASRVIHKMGANVGSNILHDSLERLPRYFYSYRNKKYYGAKRDLLGRIKSNLRIYGEGLQLRLLPGISHRAERLKVWREGVAAGKQFNPDIEFADRYEE
ncbi:glycosyltransferase family 2 protein [Weissella soli]|uniref:glycosyltransferase family 2 protein n=1 Tax=Weissella soli TaxID=155866 RepID=UPI0035A03463